MIIYSFKYFLYSCDAIFSCNEIGILNVDLKYINLYDTNYDGDDPATIIYVRLLAWHIKFEKRKALEKDRNEDGGIFA